MKLSGCSAVVTGGASGLGEATARKLAAEGVKVAIFDMNAEKGEAVAKDIGGVFCNVNVTSDESVDAGFAKARAANGQERILINCAGTGNAAKTAGRNKADGTIKHFPLDAFNLIIQINLVGTFRCIAKSAKGMLDLGADGRRRAGRDRQHRFRRGRGRPDGPGGLFGVQGRRGRHDPSRSPAIWPSDGIRVNTILPGIFNTPLMHVRAAEAVKQTRSRPRCPSPSASARHHGGIRPDWRVDHDARNGYFNGEDVRLDGAIRMAPR